MNQQLDEMEERYKAFESETAAYRSEAACAKGCAFCCTDAGSIDITTLEGWRIRDAVARMPRARQTSVKKAMIRDLKKREAGGIAACPFLMKNKACMIYAVRPFACRRIYSLHRCSRDNPPLLSRRVVAQAQKVITALQRLDENGYTGHISFILHMLDAPAFRATYLAGKFKPEEIMAFGKTHRIVINKMVVN
jgi:hypothetical protein